MDLFKLTFTTIMTRKLWVAMLLLAVLLPIVLPYFTPWEATKKLLEPARAQAAWSCCWLIGILWSLSQAARFGDSNSRTGMGAYLISQGVGPLRQIFNIWLAVMLFIIPLAICAVVICLTMAMPGDSEEASMWVATNFQFAALFLLTIAPLALLAIGLGSRFGALIAYIVPGGLCFYGLYGVSYLGMTIKMQDNPLLEWIYVLSPQYHLADLTPRLIFKMGHLPALDFGIYTAYFALIGLVFGAISILLFRTKPLEN